MKIKPNTPLQEKLLREHFAPYKKSEEILANVEIIKHCYEECVRQSNNSHAAWHDDPNIKDAVSFLGQVRSVETATTTIKYIFANWRELSIHWRLYNANISMAIIRGFGPSVYKGIIQQNNISDERIKILDSIEIR